MQSGLEDVVVAETELSHVDGAAGALVIRGAPIADVAAGGLEAVLVRLHEGPGGSVPARRAALGEARVRRAADLARLLPALEAREGITALRGALAQVEDVEGVDDLVALTGLVTAAWVRRRAGAAPIPPDPSLDHAADLLRMAIGTTPSEARAAALGRYLATVAEHGMNASTFAARVVTSTGADAVSAVVAALGALKGPLHGGAPGPVLDMLDAVGTPEAAARWIEAELQAGRRIMGMGHRVYRVRDPRAAVLEEAVQGLARAGVAAERLALAQAVEQAAEAALRARRPDRSLRANVEFYTAVLLEAVGIERAAFTAVFACGRVVGWLAHVAEQRRTGRMIRPRAAYVGPKPSCQ